MLLSPREIYLLAKTVGTTNVVMLDRSGQCTMIDVAVGMDTAALLATFEELLPEERHPGNLRRRLAGAPGTVSDASAIDRALDIGNGAYVRRASGGPQMQGTRAAVQDQIINLMSVAAPQQVMLRVKVAEIAKALLDQYGINFARAYISDGALKFMTGIFGGNPMLGGKLSGMLNPSVRTGNGGHGFRRIRHLDMGPQAI